MQICNLASYLLSLKLTSSDTYQTTRVYVCDLIHMDRFQNYVRQNLIMDIYNRLFWHKRTGKATLCAPNVNNVFKKTVYK